MARKKTILIVDDDRNMRIALYEALVRNGYHAVVAENGTTALDLIRKNGPDLVIADIRMPEMDGITLLRLLREEELAMPVLIITGYATVATAVEAMKYGACDYILKPFPVEVIESAVARVFAAEAEETALPPGRGGSGGRNRERPVIGRDPKILAVLDKARKIASSKATVLIMGESGTGKEVLARFIHEVSSRCSGPFVALNCAALPEGLLESELFGHEKGAFTGAVTSKKGRFELADGGTLLLDEISEIPLHLQAKLLRVLQEEEVDRLGGRAPVAVDVHVLATTNRDLAVEVKEGRFRQDLYYRLNVIPLVLPPLRERKGDIDALVAFFIGRYCQQYGMKPKTLSATARDRFLGHDWPGNVREMENLIERAVLLAEGEQLTPADFWDEPRAADPPTAHPEGPAADFGELTLREVERQMILQALQKTDNNRTHAARMLGVSVRTLRNKLHEYRNSGDTF
ncbi:MAG: sigma-54 dependent transcriptional regulator [Thermodesulfobacteriota bacterium]